MPFYTVHVRLSQLVDALSCAASAVPDACNGIFAHVSPCIGYVGVLDIIAVKTVKWLLKIIVLDIKRVKNTNVKNSNKRKKMSSTYDPPIQSA